MFGNRFGGVNIHVGSFRLCTLVFSVDNALILACGDILRGANMNVGSFNCIAIVFNVANYVFLSVCDLVGGTTYMSDRSDRSRSFSMFIVI